ncbi:MAG: diguanylate cyclase, partial [Desulfobacteraceae bacterium]
LAMPKGYTLTEIVKNKYPDLTCVDVDNPLEALKLVSLGQADGFVGSLGIINYIIKKHFIDNVSVVSEVKLDQALPLYMAVRKDLAPLQSILNKAMDCISSRQYAQIAEKWIGDINAFGVMDDLTRDEREYLEKKEDLTVSVVENRPFEFVDENGEHAGIVIDFYRVMADRMGLSLNFITAGSHDVAKNQVIAGTSDAVSIVQEKPAVLKSLGTTLAYISYPLAIATDSQSIYISALEELKDKKIGVSKKAVFLNSLKAWYPGIGFVEVDNVEKGLAAVQRGELYALVDTAPKIGYYIQTGNMVDLKISGELPYDVKFCTGVAADEKHLIRIFDKAIHSMKKEEKRKIFQTWMSLKYEQKFDYSFLWQIVSVMVLIGIFFLYRNFALSRYNLKLAAVNNELLLANKKLEKISYMDGLTGIPNRRNFDSVLRKEWFRCKRNNDWLTVIMIDIDYFKAYNDRYGHLSGDDCLKRVAELIADIPSRPGDFVARYGGEEFVVILPDTDKAGAALIAGKILNDVEKMKIVHEDSDISSFLTVSLGGACAVPGKRGISSRHLVEEADQQLYKAKENGRNQYKIRGV